MPDPTKGYGIFRKQNYGQDNNMYIDNKYKDEDGLINGKN